MIYDYLFINLFGGMVVHESLVCPGQLKSPLFFKKIIQVPQIVWFSSIFCIFKPFLAETVWLWDPFVHSDDKLVNQTQLLQKIQTFTYVQEGNSALKCRGWKHLNRLEMCKLFLFGLNLMFHSFSSALQNICMQYYALIMKNTLKNKNAM